MNEKEREHLMSEIHSRIGQPGIVLEWHQVEMRRRYELEWERRNEIERLVHPERLALPALVTVDAPPPAPPPEVSPTWKRTKERQRQQCERILANIGDEEAKEFFNYLEHYGRKLPRTPKPLSRTILKFRLWRQEQQADGDREFFQLHRPLETLWTLEIRDHSRIAYMPKLRIYDQPFSEMAECSIFTGADSLPFVSSLYSFVNSIRAKSRPKP